MKYTFALITGITAQLALFTLLGTVLRHIYQAEPLYRPALLGDLTIGALAAGCSLAAVKGFLFWLSIFAPQADAS